MAQSDKGEAKEISYDVYLTCRQYSQDKRIARMIEKRLHRFIIPVEYRADYSDSRIRNIYIPQEKHAGVGGLSEGARKALDRSRFLMVVCTPDTKDSTRVNREIEYFLEHHDRDRLLTVLAKGTTKTSFPTPLFREYEKNGITFMREEEEQIDANLTGGGERFQKKRLQREVTRLIARMIGCPYETLWNLDRRYRLRRTIGSLAAGVLVLIGIGGFLIYRNLQLRDSGIATTDKYEETRRLAADTMVEKGSFLLNDGDWKGAVETAMEALPYTDDNTAVHARAEGLLTKALGAYRAEGILRETYTLTLRNGMDYSLFSEDGSRLYCVDSLYDVRCFNVEDGSVIFTQTHRTPIKEKGQGEIAPANRLVLLEEDNLILCNSPGSVRAISTENGEPVWEYFFDWENDFRIMNNAQTAMAILDREEREVPEGAEKDYVVKMKLLDIHTGVVLYEAPFQIPSSFLFDYVKNYGGHNGIFTKEDDRFIGAIYVDERRQHDENNRAAGLLYFTWTPSEENSQDDIKYFHAEGVWEDFTNPVFGMVLDEAETSVMVTRYDTSSGSVRMQQIRFDGLRREPSLVPQRLRGTAPEEETNYLAGANMIAVSMNDTIHLYRKANAAYCMSKREEADILSLAWLDEEETILTAMLNNGSAVVYELDAETEDGSFIARQFTLPVMEEAHVNRIYASGELVRPDGEGYRLMYDLTMVVVLTDDVTKASVYMPYADPHVADLTPSLASARRVRLVEAPGEEDLYCFVEEHGQAGARIYAIDTVTLSVDERGHTTYDPNEADEITLAKDLRHFLVGETLYDFDDGAVPFNGHRETLLTEDESASYRASVTETGTLYLHDAATDRMIYRGENDALRAGVPLYVHADEVNGRLYVSDGSYTTCLDLGVFEQIFSVEGTVSYAPAGNKLFVNLTNADGEGTRLVAFPAYTVDELKSWGEEVLAE